MKKFYTKILTCMLVALIAFSAISMCVPVKASVGVSPLTYDEFNFSFRGGCSIARGCSGMFLDINVRATASNNNSETITLEVYLENRNVIKTYTFYSNGQTYTYKNLFLGFSGGSGVRFSFTGANPDITINVYMEIGS